MVPSSFSPADAKVKELLFNYQPGVNFYSQDEGILEIIASYSFINRDISIFALLEIAEIRGGKKGVFAHQPAGVVGLFHTRWHLLFYVFAFSCFTVNDGAVATSLRRGFCQLIGLLAD